MKYSFVLTLLLAAFSADAQLTNGGFESVNSEHNAIYWAGKAVLYDIGDSIATDNGPLYAVNTKDVHSGSNAMELRNWYNNTKHFPIAGSVSASSDTSGYAGFANNISVALKPLHFEFYCKFSPAGNDTGYAVVNVYDSAMTIIGTGQVLLTASIPVYILQQAAISYSSNNVPAFAEVTFSTTIPGKPAILGTRLLIDDVRLSQFPMGVPNIMSKKPYAVYPNPASVSASVMMDNITEVLHYTLTNTLGQTVSAGTVTPDNNTIYFDTLPAGSYSITLYNNNMKPVTTILQVY